MEICKENKDQKLVVIESFIFFFHGKNLTPTPVTLEIKIREVLNPFFGALYGLWRTKSAGLD